MTNLRRRHKWEKQHRKNNFIQILWIAGAIFLIFVTIVIVYTLNMSNDEKSKNENKNSEQNNDLPVPNEATNNNASTADKFGEGNKNSSSYSNQQNNYNDSNKDQEQTLEKDTLKKSKVDRAVKAMSNNIIKLVNDYRQKFNLKQLQSDESLETLAIKKACDVKKCVEVLKKGLIHNCPPSGEIENMLKQNGIKYIFGGENLAMGKYEPSRIVVAWIKSKKHLDNIVYPNFRFTGVGICISKKNIYWTQLFLYR